MVTTYDISLSIPVPGKTVTCNGCCISVFTVIYNNQPRLNITITTSCAMFLNCKCECSLRIPCNTNLICSTSLCGTIKLPCVCRAYGINRINGINFCSSYTYIIRHCQLGKSLGGADKQQHCYNNMS